MNYNIVQIKDIVSANGYSNQLSEIIIKMCEYMNKKQWWGACHACSSALYIILSEMGYKPILCVGEVQEKNYLFDHSWIEIDGKVIDLAISMTLAGGMAVSAPVILDINSSNKEKTKVKYGVKGQGFDMQTLFLLDMSFNEYMKSYPENKRGLWGVIEEVLGIEIDIEKLEKKYEKTKRHIKE